MSSRGMRLLSRFLILVGAVAVVGCTTAGGGLGGSGREGARQPMSQEPPASEARNSAKVHTELGALYLQESRFAIAFEEARIAIASDSSYAPAYNLLALIHMFLGESRLAEENFRRAISAAPGDPEIENNYGWFLCQNSREQESIEYFMRAARNPLYPHPTKPYTNAGLCSVRLKNDVAAERYLTQAMQLDSTNTQAPFAMAEIAYRNKRYAEARQWVSDLEKAIELNAEVTWLALRIERKLGNREGEARYSAQLRRKFANSPEQRKLLQGDFE